MKKTSNNGSKLNAIKYSLHEIEQIKMKLAKVAHYLEGAGANKEAQSLFKIGCGLESWQKKQGSKL